jgi:hypothetical protein
MHLPDAGSRDEPRCAEQNTHDESIPEHFSVNVGGANEPSEQPRDAAATEFCPFSVQPPKKLMQKIHRLTDN